MAFDRCLRAGHRFRSEADLYEYQRHGQPIYACRQCRAVARHVWELDPVRLPRQRELEARQARQERRHQRAVKVRSKRTQTASRRHQTATFMQVAIPVGRAAAAR